MLLIISLESDLPLRKDSLQRGKPA